MNMQQMINRHTPLGDPGQYVTYGVRAQPDAHELIDTTCKRVGCEAELYGWETVVDEATPLGREQAAYIRQRSGRTFREQRTEAGLTVFRFEAHQRCFAEHKTRPDLFTVRDGDWRGNPTKRGRVHANGMDWAEDFMEHESALADLRQKG